MKKNYLKFALSGLLILGSIAFSSGKPDAPVKIPNFVIQKTSELNFLMTELSKLLQPEFLVQMYQMLRSFVEKGIHLKENWFMVG